MHAEWERQGSFSKDYGLFEQVIGLETKFDLFNTILTPKSTYSWETLKSSAKIEKRLNLAQQKWLSHGDSYRDRSKTKTADNPIFNEAMTRHHMRFGENVLSQNEPCIPRVAMTWMLIQGKHKQGHPNII